MDLIQRVQLLTKDASGRTVVKETTQRAVDVEYYRDIKPLLQRSCVPCHSKSGTAQAGLVLNTALVNGWTSATAGERSERAVWHQAGDQQWRMAADERLTLCAYVPIAAQPAGVEGV